MDCHLLPLRRLITPVIAQPISPHTLHCVMICRRKVSEMKNEAKWHIQSLQTLFEDRVCLLREQKQGGKNDGAVLRAQRQMGSDVSILCTAIHS